MDLLIRDQVEKILRSLNSLFVKYIILLGEPNVAASRGIKEGNATPVLKTDGHPVFRHFARSGDAWLKVDVPGFEKPVGVNDVTTLV